MGSPPQVRGKLRHLLATKEYFRITPAGAGKTTIIARELFNVRDHPRRCGENVFAAANVSEQTGSPPQVRGKLIAAFVYSSFFWITPAGAGKTSELHIMQYQ